MRKFTPYLSFIVIFLFGIGVLTAPNVAHAASYNPFSIDFWIQNTNTLYGFFGKIIWWLLYPATGWLVYLSGSMIDIVISLTSNQAFFGSSAISTSWSIVRDIANIFFIFILIFHGIQLILNLDGVSTKKTIIGVIMAAVFINFSLFITEAVIDVSNITAAWFIEGIYAVGGERSIGGSVRASLNMEAIAKGSSATNAVQLSDFGAQLFSTGIAAVVLNCIAAYIFFQVFFLLLGRLITFVFLIITAPIGFIGFLLPQLKQYGEDWWKELNNQAMLAPMFFLMLYIVLYLADSTTSLLYGSDSNAFNPVTNSNFSVGNYVMFALLIMMLYKVLDVAKKYSGEMGGKISGILKSGIMFAAGGVAMGTVGKAANWAQNSKALDLAGFAGKNPIMGKMLLKGVKATADSGFGINSNLKNLGAGNIPGMKGAFKGAEKGYSGKIAAEKKSEEEFAKLLGEGLEGAKNRQNYAKGLENSGLFKMASGVANFVGAKKVASVIDSTGTAVNNAANRVSAGLNEDRGLNNAVKSIKESADKEYDRELGKEAKAAKEKAEIEHQNDPEIARLKTEQEELNKEIKDAGGEKLEEKIKQDLKDLERLEAKEVDAIKLLATFDFEAKTIGGVKKNDLEFDDAQMAAKAAVRTARENIVIKRTELENGSRIANNFGKRKKLIDDAIKAREKAVEETISEDTIKNLEDKIGKIERRMINGKIETATEVVARIIEKGNKVQAKDKEKREADIAAGLKKWQEQNTGDGAPGGKKTKEETENKSDSKGKDK